MFSSGLTGVVSCVCLRACECVCVCVCVCTVCVCVSVVVPELVGSHTLESMMTSTPTTSTPTSNVSFVGLQYAAK